MTAAIGHNGPPPHEALALHIEGLFSTVSGSTASPVTTDEQEAGLADLQGQLLQTRKDTDAQRVAEKKPHDDAGRAVQAIYKPLLERIAAAERAVKERLTPYRIARQKAKDDAAREAREKAEAEEAAAREKLKQVDDLEAKFEAEIKLEAAAKLRAIAGRIDRSATGLRSKQVADITDRNALVRHINAEDPDALTEFLQTYANRAIPAQLPGVTLRTERNAA